MIASIDLTTSADRLDRLDDVRVDQLGLRQRLLGECLDGPADFVSGLFGFGLELLLEQGSELPSLDSQGAANFGLDLLVCHSENLHCKHIPLNGETDSDVFLSQEGGLTQPPASSCGLGAAARDWSRAGSLSTLAISSSAPLFPSI